MSHRSDHSRASFHSSLLDLLETRAQELSASAAEARLVLQQAQTDCSRVTAELVDVQRQLKSLRAAVSSRQTGLHICVMRAFPDDLLRMIFSEVVADIRGASWWDSWDSDVPITPPFATIRRAPLDIASVCRQWRRTALDTPVLWSLLAFSLHGNMSAVDIAKVASYVALVSARSRNFPVDVALDWSTLNWPSVQQNGDMTKVRQRLEATASRWRRFLMIVPQTNNDNSLYNIFRLSTPLFELFSISAIDGLENAYYDAFPRYLPCCPRLITLCARSCQVFAIHPRGFTEALDRLDLSCMIPYPVVWQVLSLASNVSRLHLSLLDEPSLHDQEVVYETALHFPRLRHLTCAMYTDHLLAQWISRIHIPALESLELREPDFEKVAELLPHFKDSLTSLLVELEVRVLDEEFATLFSTLGSLRHLTIEAVIGDAFFPTLSASGALPLLQTLTLPSDEQNSLDEPEDPLAESILDFVYARTAVNSTSGAPDSAVESLQPCRLERVDFPDLDNVPSWFVSQLQTLIMTGAPN